MAVEYAECTSADEWESPDLNECPGYNTKLLQLLSFGECGSPHHYHYFQAHFDQEC